VNEPTIAHAGPQSGAGDAGCGPRRASDEPRARIGLLTGPVGVGKTTVAERVVGLARRQGLACGGLLAPAMVNTCGQKVGIWGVGLLSGERRILARTDRDPSGLSPSGRSLGGPTVGPYSFDAAALDWSVGVVVGAIGACDLLIVDEIGKLELWQGIGLAPILPRLAAGEVERALVLVRESLLAELQVKLGAVKQVVFRISEENRGAAPRQILDNFNKKQED
jgi:nucleoside-triphosphatase THEP1